MLHATQDTLAAPGGGWRVGAVRDVYQRYNDLILQVILEALFGASLDPASAPAITGERCVYQSGSEERCHLCTLPQAASLPACEIARPAGADLPRAASGCSNMALPARPMCNWTPSAA